MLRTIKLATLAGLRATGVFRLVRESRWRRHRLLILCYHGIAQADEHLWRPGLFMPPDLLEQRLQALQRGKYSVMNLNEGLQRLQASELPPRSVVITFDDGGFDFYKVAYPLLEKYRYPATVYQTTYYSDYQAPIFNLICSYLLWQRRGQVLNRGHEVGLESPMDLRTEQSRHEIVRKLMDRSEKENLTGAQKNQIAADLANVLDLDFEALCRKRILHLMTRSEVADLISRGVDIQLHTHRHRTPEDERAFRLEIQDNRKSLPEAARSAKHFCYPAGVYRKPFLKWLQEESVISATTCDVALATRQSDPLLLPRFVDTTKRTNAEFESWLTGVGDLLAFRRAATQQYSPEGN